MKQYQLTLVLKSSLTEQNRKKFLETVKSWLKDAKFTKEEDLGEKPLSYTIKKQNQGFYWSSTLELKESLTKDFAKKIIGNDNVLRHLLLRI